MGHWLTHLLVATTVAALAVTWWLMGHPGSAPPLLVAVAVGHLVGAVPDMLEAVGARQARWMDVFLGSVSAHYAPAGNVTWAVLALLAVVTYARTWPGGREAGCPGG